MKNICCTKVNNLDTEVIDESREVSICRVCGKKHYKFSVDSGFYGLTLRSLGRHKDEQGKYSNPS